MTPGRYLLLGFMVIIILGAALLKLPISQTSCGNTTWTEAFFTSTSAVCVTGLSVEVTATHWSLFGQCVIMVLIEIGGLGFMSFTTMFMIAIGRRITLKERLRIRESLNQTMLSGGIRLIRKVFCMSIGIQMTGAILLMFRFIPQYGFARGIYYGIFHSISAFCNAGFDILGDVSLSGYASDGYVTIIIAMLIIAGGLGCFIWMDLFRFIQLRREKQYSYRRLVSKLTLQSKMVLLITGVLLLGGWLSFLIIEWNNPATIGNYTVGEKLLVSFFQSVTLRTAGFYSVSQAGMKGIMKFLCCIWMFIGAASGGTAGGIKVATMGVLLLTLVSEVTGKADVEAFGRRISNEIIRKAMAIFGISLLIVLLFAAIIGTMESFEFMDILYETVSALSTTGLSAGITGSLSKVSQWILIVGMYIGRTGSLTLAVALQRQKERKHNSIHYPEESIMVG